MIPTTLRNEGNTTASHSLPLRGLNASDLIQRPTSTIIPKSDERQSHSIDSIDKKKVVCVEIQPQILDKVVLNPGIPCKTRFFLECLCNNEVNKDHTYDDIFKMLVQDINQTPQLQEAIEKILCHRFPENHEEGIRDFFTTYHNDTNTLRSLDLLHASDERYHRFYSPLDFINGILDNIYSGRPMVTKIEGETLHIEYKPLKKSEITTDWREIDPNPDYVQGSIVSVSKKLLTSPEAHIKTKENLDRWFLMIKRALPVKRIDNGCFQRCAFAESLLRSLGLKTQIITIYPEKNSKQVKFNSKSTYQLDVSWVKHQICAVKLPGSDKWYALDFPYEETIPLDRHPNFYSGNHCDSCDPEQNPKPEPYKVSHGFSTMMFLQNAWRAQQCSDSKNYAPDKPEKVNYFTYMTWDKQNRQWRCTTESQ